MSYLRRLIVFPLRAPLAWVQREYRPGQHRTLFGLFSLQFMVVSLFYLGTYSGLTI
jgi:hypothetical protein